MRLNSRIKGFLLNLIKSSSSTKQLKIAELALTIIERGIIFENELSWLQSMGYKG